MRGLHGLALACAALSLAGGRLSHGSERGWMRVVDDDGADLTRPVAVRVFDAGGASEVRVRDSSAAWHWLLLPGPRAAGAD